MPTDTKVIQEYTNAMQTDAIAMQVHTSCNPIALQEYTNAMQTDAIAMQVHTSCNPIALQEYTSAMQTDANRIPTTDTDTSIDTNTLYGIPHTVYKDLLSTTDINKSVDSVGPQAAHVGTAKAADAAAGLYSVDELMNIRTRNKVRLTDEGVRAFLDRMIKTGWMMSGAPVEKKNIVKVMRGWAKYNEEYRPATGAGSSISGKKHSELTKAELDADPVPADVPDILKQFYHDDEITHEQYKVWWGVSNAEFDNAFAYLEDAVKLKTDIEIIARRCSAKLATINVCSAIERATKR